MSVQFLSEEYFTAATDALNGNGDFASAIANIDMAIQFTVTEAPEGVIDFYLTAADGKATMASGALGDTDVSISSTYDTALAMFNGDLNTQMAFMTGKIKADGNLAVIMMNQGVINQWANIVADLDVES